MKQLISEIMNEFECTESDAMTILDNILSKSNISRRAILNAAKKEYELK